jgi:hypothetical protein
MKHAIIQGYGKKYIKNNRLQNIPGLSFYEFIGFFIERYRENDLLVFLSGVT